MSDQQSIEVRFNDEQREEVRAATGGYKVNGVTVSLEGDRLKAEPMRVRGNTFVGGYIGNTYVAPSASKQAEQQESQPVSREPKQVIIELTDEQQAQVKDAFSQEANHVQFNRNADGSLTAGIFYSPGVGTTGTANLRVS